MFVDWQYHRDPSVHNDGMTHRWSRFWSPLAASIAMAVLSLICFERLADDVLKGDTKHFDSMVRTFVHGFASPGLTMLMRALTDIGNIGGVMIGAAVACSALWLRQRRTGALLLAISTFGGGVLMWSLKLLFHRQRPVPYFGITKPSDYSFPSGHALVAFCFYVTLAAIITTEQRHLISRIFVWIGACIMVCGIGLSRIYLGVHYPSDVLAGYLAALFWVSGISLVYRRFHRRDITQDLQLVIVPS